MKIVKLHIDDKLYWRMRENKFSYNEIIALGFRLKQILEIIEREPKAEIKPAVTTEPKAEGDVKIEDVE